MTNQGAGKIAELQVLNRDAVGNLKEGPTLVARQYRTESWRYEFVEDLVHALRWIRHIVIQPPFQQSKQLAG